jgi:hypothetical protein
MAAATGLHASFFADEHFLRLELKLLGQTYSLAPIVHEDFRFALHSSHHEEINMAYTVVYAK